MDAVQEFWKPKDGPETVFLEWVLTERYNYRCRYCEQDHRAKGAFQYHPAAVWKQEFDRHFKEKGRNLSLAITGGEALVHPEIWEFLEALSVEDYAVNISLDTNLSPMACRSLTTPRRINLGRFWLSAGFHPDTTTFEDFIGRLVQVQEAGHRFFYINYVITDASIDAYEDRRDQLKELGVILHPNPFFPAPRKPNPRHQTLIKRHLNAVDFPYKMSTTSPKGKLCLSPAVAYVMLATGKLYVSCASFKQLSGDFFDEELPTRFEGYTPCSHATCGTIYRYSFLKELGVNVSANPRLHYVSRIWDRWSELEEQETTNQEDRGKQDMEYDPDAWERIASSFDNGFAQYGWLPHRQNALDWAVGKAQDSILDIGCCRGAFGQAIKERFTGRVAGVDITPTFVEDTCSKGLEAYVADARELPFEDGEFQTVLLLNVIMHLDDPQRAVHEAARVAGKFLILSCYGTDEGEPVAAHRHSFLSWAYPDAHLRGFVPKGWVCKDTARFDLPIGKTVFQYLWERE